MRLPADAVLLTREGEEADLLRAAWRGAGLPVVVADPRAPPAAGETGFACAHDDLFADGRLDAGLTRAGVTTLVVCGDASRATARHALGLGYRVFAVDAVAGEADGLRVVDVATAAAAADLAAAMRERRRGRR